VFRFAIIQGQTYFVRLTSLGSGGPYQLALQTSVAPVLGTNLPLPGKVTFVELNQSFTATIPLTTADANAQQLTADAISTALVQEFIASQQGHLTGSYLLLWTDPVDFVLTDPVARQDGYTADRGPINEIEVGYNSGAGALKLVIAPFVIGSYELELIGVGAGPVLFGARLITASGESVAPASSPASSLPVALPLSADLVVVLDFNGPRSGPSGVTPVPGAEMDDSGGPPTTTANPAAPAASPFLPVAGSTFVTSSFSIIAGPFFLQTLACFQGFRSASAPSNDDAEAPALPATAVTALFAPGNSIIPGMSRLTPDEPALQTPLKPPDHDLLNRGIDPTMGVGAGTTAIKRLGGQLQEMVQPLINGFNTLGSHLRTILKVVQGIFSILNRNNVSGNTGRDGASLRRGVSDPVVLSSGLRTANDRGLELWDLALKNQTADNRLDGSTDDPALMLITVLAMALPWHNISSTRQSRPNVRAASTRPRTSCGRRSRRARGHTSSMPGCDWASC
jgi:hypothetical protein